MTQEVDLLSTREQASLILISIFLFWVLSKKDLRANIQRIIWTLLSPVILLPLIVMFAYVSFEVWIGFQLGLWSNQLAKATVIWAVAAGVVLSSKGILEANKDPLFFRKTAAATIAPTVFVTFFMNLASFNLLAEVALQLFLVPVTALSAFAHARTDREYERVKKLCNGILSLVGFSWLAFTVHHVHKTWNQLDTHLLFQKLGLPHVANDRAVTFHFCTEFVRSVRASIQANQQRDENDRGPLAGSNRCYADAAFQGARCSSLPALLGKNACRDEHARGRASCCQAI